MQQRKFAHSGPYDNGDDDDDMIMIMMMVVMMIMTLAMKDASVCHRLILGGALLGIGLVCTNNKDDQ